MSATGGQHQCEQAIDAAAYVLGALEEPDAYREHLEECPACRAEVAHLQLAADTLPTAVPQVAPPATLRERVLETVRAEAELLRAASTQVERGAGARTRRRLPRVSLAGAGLALAAAVAVAVAIAVNVGSGAHERVTVGSVADIPGAAVSLRQIDDRAELVVSGMPQPALGRIYEVWLLRGASTFAPTDALFGVTRRGSGSVDVPGNLHGVREVLVTSEPLGGSAHPTSAPVLRVALSA